MSAHDQTPFHGVVRENGRTYHGLKDGSKLSHSLSRITAEASNGDVSLSEGEPPSHVTSVDLELQVKSNRLSPPHSSAQNRIFDAESCTRHATQNVGDHA